MAEIIRMTDRLDLSRTREQTEGRKAEILLFTGIRYERRESAQIPTTRKNKPRVPALPKPREQGVTSDVMPF
ncbi:hypothetical protein PDO_1101 [Rhizobium sp. PDO1-076]|uniref:hypothetical protein n=1 Tax=Rhizobium sp. PDO1-076 TaxID=1125979 RepID=UPI00024E370A|nr:hypothetical protein [Rhizobium sp. PDO1-076]EHS53391.1 hypothetical protein PDO_1101 [Rhizobium sp. PDO1-076]